MVKRLIAFLAAVLLALPDSAQGLDSLRRFVGNIDLFNRLFPQEKVYLHFDNTAYFRGETVWFSAYVVRTDKQRLTDLSRVLYVELLDPIGDVVQTCKLRLDGGRASGSIKLDKLLTSGFYEVRAYTRYMLNWDEAWVFSRVFPIFNAPKEAGDYSHPVMAEQDYRKRLPSVRPPDSRDREAINVVFYPEGGRLVRGLASKVAFAVTGKDGRPLDTAGTLTLPDGTTAEIRTLREGRGVFDYTPASAPATLTLTDKKGKPHKFTLPNADAAGCVLTVDACDDHHVYATVSRTADYDGPLAMVLVNGGNVDATDIIQPGEKVARRRFAKADMSAGVSQLALIRPDGAIVAERMVFVYPHERPDTIRVTTESTLAPCGKVTLNVRTLPGATFSMAVRDKAAEANGQAGDAATWMLLASDLRGYIHNPEYYLEADDDTHRRAADLLMMVQGWRRYELSVMTGREPFVRRHPIEDGLYLYGRLYQAKKKYKVDGVSLTATLYNRAGESMNGRARTDSAGSYAFRLPDCEGEWTLLLNTRKGGEAAKYRVGIDRNISPRPRPLSPLELGRTETEAPALSTVSHIPSFDAEAGRLPMSERVHILKEVNVKGRRLFENARAAWETEQRGAFKAYLRYDCDKASDEIYDRGGETPSIFEWLVSKNRFFSGDEEHRSAESYTGYDLITEADESGIEDVAEFSQEARGFMTNGGLSYKNRPIVWILNNTFYMGTSTRAVGTEDIEYVIDQSIEDLPMWLDDYKCVYISEDDNIWRHFVICPALEPYYPVTVFLYSHHAFPAKHKGLRHTYFDGYSKVETFQMPDYSLMPKEADHRRTLYWNPAVKADGRGEATVELYNNSSCKVLTISAEGITVDGRAVVYKADK